MIKTIKAIYERGIIKPLEPVPFEAKQMVLITFHNEETDKDFNISDLTTNETIPKRQPLNKEKAEMALEALYGCAKSEKLIESYKLSHGLLIPDAIIAATAIMMNSELFSQNARHFQMIKELKVTKPY